MSASLPVESAACLVVAAVFKTVEGQSVLGGFNSFPLRQLPFYANIGGLLVPQDLSSDKVPEALQSKNCP